MAKPERVGMNEVAREAGVGVATVDRVINRRAPVRPETAARVLAAAERLGFHRSRLIRHRLDQAELPLRLAVVLQKRAAHFYAELAQALQHEVRQDWSYGCRLQIEFVDDLAPQAMVDRLEALAGSHDVIVVVAADHPAIHLCIDRLAGQGVAVLALVSPLSASACAGYLGIDHFKVGRLAAWAVHRLGRGRGPAGLLVGSHRYLCQAQNEMGFRAYAREHAPRLRVLDTLSSLEEPRLAQAATLELLARHPDLRGLYVAGGGIEGVLQGIRDAAPARDLVVVCHDLTDTTRQALIDARVSLVISHPLAHMARRLVELAHQCRTARWPAPLQCVLPFTSHTVANV